MTRGDGGGDGGIDIKMICSHRSSKSVSECSKGLLSPTQTVLRALPQTLRKPSICPAPWNVLLYLT